MDSVQSREQNARNSARTFSALVAIASVIALFSYPATGVDAAPRGPYIALFLIGVVCLTASVFLRRLPVYGFNLISLVSLVAASAEDVHTNWTLSLTGLRFEPFLGSKVIGLAIALLAFSPIELGFAIIILCALYPVFAYYVLIPPEFRMNISSPEPWTTVFYAIISLAILVYRHRGDRFQRQLVQANTEKVEAQKQALKFLAIRDLSNTPLQAIEISSFLMKAEFPTASEFVHGIEKSLDELRKLDKILSSYTVDIKWDDRTVSFDAASVLKRAPPN